MNETEKNFWEVWNSMTWADPAPVLFRLYYDEQGYPLFYSQEDNPGNYIDITPEQYAIAAMNVRVRNGELQPAARPCPPKLVPSNTGTPCHPEHVDIVVSLSDPHTKWKLKRYETD